MRKCATSGRKKRVSSSRSRRKRSWSAGERKLSARRRESTGVITGLPGSGWSTPDTVIIAGWPAVRIRSDAPSSTAQRRIASRCRGKAGTGWVMRECVRIDGTRGSASRVGQRHRVRGGSLPARGGQDAVQRNERSLLLAASGGSVGRFWVPKKSRPRRSTLSTRGLHDRADPSCVLHVCAARSARGDERVTGERQTLQSRCGSIADSMQSIPCAAARPRIAK